MPFEDKLPTHEDTVPEARELHEYALRMQRRVADIRENPDGHE